jgi:hypothetical protein
MSVTLQDFALTDANTQIGATDSGLKSGGTRQTSVGGKVWDSITRSSTQKQEFENAKNQFVSLVRAQYPPEIADTIESRLRDRLSSGSPLTGFRARALLSEAETMRTAMSDAPGQFLGSAEVTSLIGQELQTHENQRLVQGYPSVIGEANRDTLTAEVRERVMKNPEFEQARKSSDFEGTVRKLIHEESEAVLKPRLDMALEIHFSLKHQTPPFDSSKLSKREAVHLVETCLQGNKDRDQDSVSFTTNKATRGFTALRECAEKEGFKPGLVVGDVGSDLDDIMENSFDSRMVERLPSYLSEEAFGKAVDREMTLAKGIHNELLGSDVWPTKEERPKGLDVFARGLLRLSHELPGDVSPSRLLEFGRATDAGVKSKRAHSKPFENLNQNARALRSDLFTSFERSLNTGGLKTATDRLSRGVHAFIELPPNIGSEALRTREVPPSIVDVGTALRFNDILGPTDAKRLMALYREAAELRETGNEGLPSDMAALRDLGRATALLRELEPLRQKLGQASDLVSDLRLDLQSQQGVARVDLHLSGMERPLPGMENAGKHGQEFAELLVSGSGTKNQFSTMAQQFSDDLASVERYGNELPEHGGLVPQNRPMPSPEGEMSLRRLRFTAQVMASGSNESSRFVRELMADPGRNPIGVRLFQTALGQAMQTHDWENMSQNERDRLVDDIVEGVKEKYVGSSVTPRHMQVVQGELQHSRDLHAGTLTEGISGQFVKDVDRVHFGLNGKPVGPKATGGRHTPDDVYDELRGNFRTKYGEDAPRMLAVVTSVANQSPLVGLPLVLHKNGISCLQGNGETTVSMETREDRVLVTISMEGGPSSVSHFHGDGNIDMYRLQDNEAESEPENLQIRQVVRFEVRRPETPGGEPAIHALDFSEEAFINKDNLRHVPLSSK